MKQLTLVAFLIASCVACSKNHDDNKTLNKTDTYFMQQASYSNLAEISAGGIAATRGSYDSVKMFGSMMIGDHSKAQASLASLATNLNIEIPLAPDPAHQAKAAMLQTLSGHQFDTAYINAQVVDHIATIAIFQQEISGGNNNQVVGFANKNLPVIQMHLQEALGIKAKL